MSGRDPINPLFIGYFRQKFPLQLIIAEGTGNGGMPRQIFIYKVTDYTFTLMCRGIRLRQSLNLPQKLLRMLSYVIILPLNILA